MLFEPTSLAATAKLVAETLESHYAVDPVPVFEKAGLDYGQLSVSGGRYRFDRVKALWNAAPIVSKDPCFGLYAGEHIRPTSFHALGFSWLSSQTLLGSIQRLCRYHQVITTAPAEMKIELDSAGYIFTVGFPNPDMIPADTTIDAFFVGFVRLCRIATDSHFCPESVALRREDFGRVDDYVKALDAPVTFGAERNTIRLDREKLHALLPGHNIDIVKANDRVVEHYLATMEPHRVAAEVREILIQLLPSGKASQNRIAEHLHRSLSTLQRQLQTEGTNYQQIREETRRILAQDYVSDGELSLSQIAYLLGFSDQSNFSRAFKRWTGVSPREYRS